MRWSQDDYPDSMARLDPRTRAEAIDIANALVEEGYDEHKAITIGKAQAIGAAERAREAQQSASTGGQVEPLVENVDTMLEDHGSEDRGTGGRDELEQEEGSNPERQPQQSDEEPQHLPYRDEPYEHETTDEEQKSEGKEESPRYGQA